MAQDVVMATSKDGFKRELDKFMEEEREAVTVWSIHG